MEELAVDRNDVNWRGYWPASLTPFTEGGQEVDDDELRRLLRWYLSQGMHGVLVNGSTGEWYVQTDAERRRVAGIAVDELSGSVPVVIGCTTYRAEDTIELARHARDIGADGILSSPPPYLRPQPEEIYAFFAAISDAVDIPIMVYNWPPGTSVDIGPELAGRLADIPNVVAIKDSTFNTAQFYRTLLTVRDRLRVFGNFLSPLGIEVYSSLGGDGFIGGGMMLGREEPEFFEAMWRGDFDRAGEIAAREMLWITLLYGPDLTPKFGWGQIKAAMRLLGQPVGYTRLPMLPLTDPAQVSALRRVLGQASLLDQELV
jgi:1-pyrroline-4-hydroxy-2-carboxylate deaminase